jgi:hypothetical protein
MGLYWIPQIKHIYALQFIADRMHGALPQSWCHHNTMPRHKEIFANCLSVCLITHSQVHKLYSTEWLELLLPY